MPLTKTQDEWTVLARQIGTYVRIWERHNTNIVISDGWDEIATAISTNFNNDDDARARNQQLSEFIQDNISQEEGRKTAIAGLFNSFILNDMKEFLKSGSTLTLRDKFDAFGVNTQTGILKDFQQGMVANTATSQFVLRHTISSATPTSNACNTVSGTVTDIVTVITTNQMARTQRVAIVCTDETHGNERFTISGEVTGAERTKAQVGTDYYGFKVGLKFKLVRPISEFNDGSNQISALVTNRGERSANTDTISNVDALRLHGVLWNNHQGSNEVRVYSASSDALHTNLATNLVMIGTKGTGGGTMTLAETNSSGLSGSLTVDAGGAFTADLDIYWDLLRFRLNDAFFIDTTREEQGRFQRFATDVLGIPFNAGTNDQVTLPEELAGG